MCGHSLLIQSHDLIVASFACPTAFLLAAFVSRRAFGGARYCIRCTQNMCRLLEYSSMPREASLYGFSSVLEQVKAISDLLGMRCPCRSPSSVISSTIAADELDFRMVLDPLSEGRLRAIWEQVNHTMPFQIEENRSIRAPAPKGEIIHAKNRHQGRWWFGHLYQHP
jgi:hypothetical protein